MFWKFLLIVAFGMILFKLGSYSVLVSVLVTFAKLVVILVLGFIAMIAWKKYRAQ